MNKDGKPSFKERFKYWFDNHMSNGSLGLIRILLIATILVIGIIGLVILICGFADDMGADGVFWETMSTVINAWMPSFEDGGIGYVILMALAAIAGLLVTSVLIGIFSAAIEDKINNLKNGNSKIIEEDHIVVLGYTDGEFALIEQLVAASEDDKRCIVVAGDAERSEMEEAIRSNVDIPKNVRLVCRNIDIYDPASLEKCCIDKAQAVIINPMNDIDTVKALLAVSSIVESSKKKVYICSVVSRSRHLLPDSYKAEHNITQLLANRLLSKIIAHSCTQPGISETLIEFLDYDGCNLCEAAMPGLTGLSFREIMARLSGGVPVGIFKGDRSIINPDPEMKLEASDKLLVFTEDPENLKAEEPAEKLRSFGNETQKGSSVGSVLIVGVNEEIPTILRELPSDIGLIRIAGANKDARKEITDEVAALKSSSHPHISVEFLRDSIPKHMNSLEELIRDSAHVVLLNDHEKEPDEADTENIMRILNLKAIRKEKGLHFNITAELRRELSQRLAGSEDGTDFVVASNMISLFLSQLADKPDLEPVFRELLSNEGSELYLKTPAQLCLGGDLTVRNIRMAVLEKGYILIGYMSEEDGTVSPVFDPDPAMKLDLDTIPRLIVIGED